MKQEQIIIKSEGNGVFLSYSKLELFFAYKDEGGLDAELLYLYYMYHGRRLQYDVEILTPDEFTQDDLGWDNKRLNRAKLLLKKLELIEYGKEKR